MFGQHANDQQQNDQNNFGAPFGDAFGTPPPAPGAPIGPLTQDQPITEAPAPAAPDATATPAPVQDLSTPEITAHASGPSDDELLDIKQEALHELTPLVGHLEQSPEEKFRTTMMLIQASDDHTLVKTAYDAAKQITDEKVRAQALLDVVNEINYFTQQHSS